MPTHTAQDQALQQNGPVVEIHIALQNQAREQLAKAGQTELPGPVRVQALVDTGASSTTIQPEVVKKLGLQPVGVSSVTTPTSKGVLLPRYAVGLVLPTNQWWETVVIAAPLQGQDIEALIGRDLLAHGVFVYTGISGSWSLSF